MENSPRPRPLWQISSIPRMPLCASAVGRAWLRPQGRVPADEKQEDQGARGSEICVQRGQPAWLPGMWKHSALHMGGSRAGCSQTVGKHSHALLHLE